MHGRLLIAATLVALLATGCSSSRGARKSAWEKEGGAVAGGSQADPKLVAAAEAAWKNRGDKAQLMAAIDAWKKIVDAKTADAKVLSSLSRAYYLLGEGFTEEPEQKLVHFDTGATYGEQALMTFPAFEGEVKAGKKPEDAVARLGKEAIDALYWNAVNVGKWAKTKGSSTILFYKSRVKKMIEHALALDEKYFYGAPHRYLGAYYAAAPGFSGGDVEKSKEHFDKALAIEPNYFGTRVLYAVEYAVKAQDADVYKQQLEMVINGKPEVLPDVVPEQKIEIEKAKKELPKMEDLF